MKKYRNTIFYVIVIGFFSCLMYWVVGAGKALEAGKKVREQVAGGGQWAAFTEAMAHNLAHPLAILLVQIVTIMLVARFFGWIFKKIGQPTVIGEIIAGIVLGPSLLGSYFPDFFNTLFPSQSLGNLQFLSQIGLILFMYVIGMELDLKSLKSKAQDALVVSHASIVIPFALGMLLAYFIYDSFAPESVSFLAFSLFLGIAMSITAFPVLARIVQERGIHKTRLGTMVITCAAADDISAWCLLASVIAIVKAGSFVSSLYVILLAVGYVALMLMVVKPFLKRVGDLHTSREHLSKPVVAIFFVTLLISAYATEVIGIHALFGAFMAGVIMPENAKFRNIFVEKVEDVALVLLLPLFFVFTGLRTQIGLLNDPGLWLVCGGIIAVAVTGKFVGSALSAKFVGQNWHDSLIIGALMNTRGLMELVVLNIGYDLGILTSEVFAMMVIMALVTTFMTGPALDLIGWLFKVKKEQPNASVVQHTRYRILVSFANPEKGKFLLRLANGLVKKLNGNANITAMHLTPSGELTHFNADEYEEESFTPIITESRLLNQPITTLFKVSNDIDADIAEVANKGNYDLLLIGLGQSIFEGSLLGKVLGFTTSIVNPDLLLTKFSGKEKLFENSPFDERTRLILSKTDIPVGILANHDLLEIRRIFIPIFDEQDNFLLYYAQKFIVNADAQITILDAQGHIKNQPVLKEAIRSIEQNVPNHIALIGQQEIVNDFFQQSDLVVVSINGWKKLIHLYNPLVSDLPSVLMLRDAAE